jgi:hypothetical protein
VAEAKEDGGGSGHAAPPASPRETVVRGVKYLPPLTVRISLPPLYPLVDAPAVELECSWLDSPKLSRARAMLMEMWESTYKGGPVVFSWVEWLEHELLAALGVQFVLSLEGAPPPPLDEHDGWDRRLLQVLSYTYAKENEVRRSQQWDLAAPEV